MDQGGVVVVSLFDGLGGGITALKRAGIKIKAYYASEIDAPAMEIAKKNHPEIVHIGDVTKLQEADLKALGPVDLLIGGSPCTNLSFVGNLKGMSTKEGVEITTLDQYKALKRDGFEFVGQSYLFWEYIRIKDILQPKNYLLENNPMPEKYKTLFSDIIGCNPTLINSALLSAQSRRRLYWSNIANIQQPEDLGIKLQTILESGTAHREKSKCVRIGGRGSNDRHEWDIANKEGRRYTPLELERLQTLPDGYTSGVSNAQRCKMIGNGWTIDVIAHIFNGLKKTTATAGN